MGPLNREILRLSLPSILANITVPLVGMVDTAVAGHIILSGENVSTAALIGAISVGAMVFNLIYWNFSFLRTGTGGLTAQAYGRSISAGSVSRGSGECLDILLRGLVMAFGSAFVILLLQWPLLKLALLITNASPQVEALASRYFYIRIWAAPATLALKAFSGWFVGMQDSSSSMWKDLVVNGVNIVSSIVLALGIGAHDGIGFDGIAWGTVIAQYSGLAFCLAVLFVKYHHLVAGSACASPASSACAASSDGDTPSAMRESAANLLKRLFRSGSMHGFMKMNADLFGRSLFFEGIYVGYTLIAAGCTDVVLACSSIMMQLLMIFSFFTDGFAYAGEALTGRFIGARQEDQLRLTVKYVFIWSMSIAVLFIGLYQIGGGPLLHMMTSDPVVYEACREYLPWLLLMPPIGCAAFTWDGIFLGATASRAIRNSMMYACIGFLACWFILRFTVLSGTVDSSALAASSVFDPASTVFDPAFPASAVAPMTLADAGSMALHCLLAAYFVHLAARAIYLTLRYRKDVLSALTQPR